MAIWNLPTGFTRAHGWAQPDGRKALQRSEFTGRTRELLIGPADRWQCSADVRPMTDADLVEWRAFQMRMKQPGARARIAATEGGQNEAAALIANPDFEGAGSWIFPASILRSDLYSASGIPPKVGKWGVTLFPVSGAEQYLQANGGATTLAAPGDRVYLSAWVMDSAGTLTGSSLLFVEWLNSGGTQIGTAGANISPAGAAGVWRRVIASAVAPAGTAAMQFALMNDLTAGVQWATRLIASTMPVAATVASSGAVGQTLPLSGLKPSTRNLRAGDMITVSLPSGDEQLIGLLRDLVADGSGNATAHLAAPLRETPASGAIVELSEPWALMRASDPVGWGAEPGRIYQPMRIDFEEAF